MISDQVTEPRAFTRANKVLAAQVHTGHCDGVSWWKLTKNENLDVDMEQHDFVPRSVRRTPVYTTKMAGSADFSLDVATMRKW